MNLLGSRLRARRDDLCDWLDYRPDPDFRPFLLLPGGLALVYAFTTAIGLGIVFFAALLVTALVAVLGLFALVGWVLCAALGDCASERLAAPTLVRQQALR